MQENMILLIKQKCHSQHFGQVSCTFIILSHYQEFHCLRGLSNKKGGFPPHKGLYFGEPLVHLAILKA